MTLPASGPLSLADVAAEFGGATPHGLQEYYRGGGLVPETELQLVEGAWSSYQASEVPLEYGYAFSGGLWFIYWAGTQVYLGGTNNLVVTGGFRYQRGSYFTTAGGGDWYQVRRQSYSNQNVNVNEGVPSSGTISLFDLYGASA